MLRRCVISKHRQLDLILYYILLSAVENILNRLGKLSPHGWNLIFGIICTVKIFLCCIISWKNWWRTMIF